MKKMDELEIKVKQYLKEFDQLKLMVQNLQKEVDELTDRFYFLDNEDGARN